MVAQGDPERQRTGCRRGDDCRISCLIPRAAITGLGDQPVRRGRRRACARAAPGQDAQPLAKRKRGRAGARRNERLAVDACRGADRGTRHAGRDTHAYTDNRFPSRRACAAAAASVRIYGHLGRGCLPGLEMGARFRDTALGGRRRQIRSADRVYPSRQPVRAAPSAASPRDARRAG